MKLRTLRRNYLREAAVMFVAARLAIRLVPPIWLVAWASRPPKRIRRFALDEVGWVSWAVETIAAKHRMNVPLARALVAQSMLRRRGIASRLCLGVAREGKELVPHAWIEHGKDIILGGAEATRSTRMATFGGDA
jgi:Transglutaminase-like superfamily